MPPQTSETRAKPASQVIPPSALVCHRIPGRFRVRIVECRGDVAYFTRVKETLEQEDCVLEVATNPRTGSVLVHHRGEPALVMERAEATGLFCARPAGPRTPTIVHWLDDLDRFDTEFLFARMRDQPQRSATGLFMLAVLQALRGSILPSAPSLLGEAMALLRENRARSERNEEPDKP